MCVLANFCLKLINVPEAVLLAAHTQPQTPKAPHVSEEPDLMLGW